MKTAISIPDPVFEAAESMAEHLGVSRSELFSKAIAEYMENHKYQHVTALLNKIYGKEASELDAELAAMQMNVLQQEKW